MIAAVEPKGERSHMTMILSEHRSSTDSNDQAEFRADEIWIRINKLRAPLLCRLPSSACVDIRAYYRGPSQDWVRYRHISPNAPADRWRLG